MNKEELIKWANDAIQQWENHDRYRVTEADKVFLEEGEPRAVRVARGILRMNEEIEFLDWRYR